MRFLADMGVSRTTIAGLRSSGHNVVHLVEEGLERLSDSEILEKALTEDRIVLTFDLDFGDLMATGQAALPSVITFRLRDQRPKSVLSRLLDTIRIREPELSSGSLLVVEDSRHRIRRLPLFESD